MRDEITIKLNITGLNDSMKYVAEVVAALGLSLAEFASRDQAEPVLEQYVQRIVDKEPQRAKSLALCKTLLDRAYQPQS